MTQIYLDVYGNFPVVGEPLDTINGGIYIYRGQYGDAALSFCSIVPVAGSVFSGSRIVRRLSRVSDDILEHGPVIADRVPINRFDEVAPPSRNRQGNRGGNGSGGSSRMTPQHELYISKQGAPRLIGAEQAIIDPRKLTEYALNPDHPVGRDKAKVFASALGYNQSNYQGLLDQIRRGVMDYPPIPSDVDKHGVRFAVDIPIIGPAGEAIVRTGWIFKGQSQVPELATIYVK